MRVTVSIALLALAASAVRAEEAENPVPTLRMIHVEDGLRSVAPKGDLGLLRSTDIYKTAKAAGVDLREPTDDLLVERYAGGRLFYLFYKTVEGAVGDRPYLIQRIKKTVREWKPGEAEPTETVTWQVEVFKTLGGTLKRPDQHYGSFGLGDLDRREIVKEYEIGFGEVPGLCEGTDWPFAAKSLYELIQPYGPAVGHYDDIVFSASKRWALAVSFASDGTYGVRSPELGFDAPDRMPERTRPTRDPATSDWVLKVGQGVKDLVVGESREEDVARVFGTPREVRRFAGGNSNHVTKAGLTVNVDKDGFVNTIFTRSEFAGKTALGIRLGSSRVEVMEAYGVPHRQQTDGPYWRYPGVVFYFDAWHEVTRIVITR